MGNNAHRSTGTSRNRIRKSRRCFYFTLRICRHIRFCQSDIEFCRWSPFRTDGTQIGFNRRLDGGTADTMDDLLCTQLELDHCFDDITRHQSGCFLVYDTDFQNGYHTFESTRARHGLERVSWLFGNYYLRPSDRVSIRISATPRGIVIFRYRIYFIGTHIRLGLGVGNIAVDAHRGTQPTAEK